MVAKTYTRNIVGYATYGIDEHIKSDETVEVNLRDLLFVSATLQELIRFSTTGITTQPLRISMTI